MFGLTAGELATVATLAIGTPGALIGGQVKLLAHFGKAERSIRQSLMEQNARCLAENAALNVRMTGMSSRIFALEREKIYAEANLILAGKIDLIGTHLGVLPEPQEQPV